MECTVDTQDGLRVVRPVGPVDVNGSVALRDLLGREIDSPGARVIIDLERVTLIDSSGIGILVGAHRRAEQAGARLAVAAPAPAVAKILSMTRVDRLLDVHESVAEAAAAVTGS